MNDWQAKQDRLEVIRRYAKFAIKQNGINATVAFIERGKITGATTKLFAPVVGSPVGSIMGPGLTRGTVRVVYTAQEVLDITEELFPE